MGAGGGQSTERGLPDLRTQVQSRGEAGTQASPSLSLSGHVMGARTRTSEAKGHFPLWHRGTPGDVRSLVNAVRPRLPGCPGSCERRCSKGLQLIVDMARTWVQGRPHPQAVGVRPGSCAQPGRWGSGDQPLRPRGNAGTGRSPSRRRHHLLQLGSP